MDVFEGRPLGTGRRIGIAVSRFNEDVTGKLLEGALDALRGAGVSEDDIVVAHVPGAFELPLAADRLAARADLDAVLTLGAVIRGETDHYDYVCSATTDGLLRVNLDTSIPTAFGVLTCQTMELALARAGGAAGNKGADAALAAVEMAVLRRAIGGGASR